MKGLLLLTLLTAGTSALAATAESASSGNAAPPKNAAAAATGQDASPSDRASDDHLYGDHSDEELTELAAHWDSLNRHQRRALLTEMKLRMARKGANKEVIHIRTERRYGRIISQPDGQVIHIETQVVHVRPVDPDELKDQQSFGVGFEQRIGRRRHELDARSADASAAAAASDVGTDGQPSLNGVLDSLVPSTQAPQVNRLPVYPVSSPKP